MYPTPSRAKLGKRAGDATTDADYQVGGALTNALAQDPATAGHVVAVIVVVVVAE